MNPAKPSRIRAVLLACLLVAVFYAQKKPEIRLSQVRVKSGDSIVMNGTGFTANRSAMSHLLKPDGTEYNPLRLRTSETGEIVHKIDTVMLDLGLFELWVEDEASKAVSNRIRFTVVE